MDIKTVESNGGGGFPVCGGSGGWGLETEQKGTSPQGGGRCLLPEHLVPPAPECRHWAASGWETSSKHEKAGGADSKGARQLPLPGAGQSMQHRGVPLGQTEDGWAQRLPGLVHKQLLLFVCLKIFFLFNFGSSLLRAAFL